MVALRYATRASAGARRDHGVPSIADLRSDTVSHRSEKRNPALGPRAGPTLQGICRLCSLAFRFGISEIPRDSEELRYVPAALGGALCISWQGVRGAPVIPGGCKFGCCVQCF